MLQQGDLEQTLRKLNQLQKRIDDKKMRRRVMRKPANIVVKAARPKIPRSRRVHYRYSTPKIVKSRRAAKGSGRVVAAYYPGNLRKSIKRLRFRRSSREFVGPRLAKRGKTKGVFGLSSTKVDGYYAQFLRGSRAAFRRAFLEPALTANASKILQVAEQEFRKELDKIKRQTKL